MDRLFDRLGELWRRLPGGGTARGTTARGLRGDTAARHAAADPFLREAEQELEEYLRSGRPVPGPRSPAPVPDSLRRDFANLGLEPTVSLEKVRRAHLATRSTQILNASFRRIRDCPRGGLTGL